MVKVDDINVEKAISDIGIKLKKHLSSKNINNLELIGIRRGGVWVADKVRQIIFPDFDLGELNIAFYRDDFSQIGLHPTIEPSKLPFDVNGKDILLFDDILYTGRTVRAAMNEIFDYGRPNSIILIVLIDRGGRELPVNPDVCGIKIELNADYHVKLSGPQAMRLKSFAQEK